MISVLPVIPRKGPDAPATLVGLARIAANSPQLGAKRKVEYFSLASRSVLNRCSSPRMPFLWTINPYRGCEFGCKYCYARYTHEYMGMENPAEFEERIYSKERAAEILKEDLRKDPGGGIAIGTVTDPYQPAERLFLTTRGILETLAAFRGLRLSITTKSDLVASDLDVLQDIARGNGLQVNMTITTLRTDLARLLEPRAPRPDLRLAAVSAVARAGIPVAVFAMPVLPGITDGPSDLEAVARAAAEAGASHFAASALFLMPSAQKAFLPFLKQEFPQLARTYRRLYSRGAYLGGGYAEKIQGLARELKEKYCLNPSERNESLDLFGPRDQLALFG